MDLVMIYQTLEAVRDKNIEQSDGNIKALQKMGLVSVLSDAEYRQWQQKYESTQALREEYEDKTLIAQELQEELDAIDKRMSKSHRNLMAMHDYSSDLQIKIENLLENVKKLGDGVGDVMEMFPRGPEAYFRLQSGEYMGLTYDGVFLLYVADSRKTGSFVIDAAPENNQEKELLQQYFMKKNKWKLGQRINWKGNARMAWYRNTPEYAQEKERLQQILERIN